jgi:hypothetical protein
MSNNKLFVKTIKTTLDSMNKDVKTSKIYEDLSELSGYRNWDTASACNVEFTQSAQYKIKSLVLAKIDLMDDQNWRKHCATFLLDHNNIKAIDSLLERLQDHSEFPELVALIVQAELSYKYFRKLISVLVEIPELATLLLKNSVIYETMSNPENILLAKELAEAESNEETQSIHR